MPIIKSAKKRVRVTAKATARNVKTKKLVKGSVKQLRVKPNQAALSKAQSAIDTAVKKGLIHKNKAARKKSRLAADAKKAGVKLGKSPVKKTATKAVTSPKAKKPVPKKAATKKPKK